MQKPIISPQQAAELIKDNWVVCVEGGSGGLADAEAILSAIEERFLETGHPRDLTLYHSNGLGDRGDRSIGHLAHEGLIKRAIGGHWGLCPKMGKLALENKIEAYNFPQGPMAQLYREIAAKRPGVITKVGLHTYVDPRLEGGKLNEITKEDLVKLVEFEGEEYLFYPAFKPDVVLLRASLADTDGNLSMQYETGTFQVLSAAQAAKNSGGMVIAQVKHLVQSGSLDPRLVKVPGFLVDALVVVEDQWQTYEAEYNPAYCGEHRAPRAQMEKSPLNERTVVARRAAMELVPGVALNVGFGMSSQVATIAFEEGLEEDVIFTIEQGPTGGTPVSGIIFGVSRNPIAIIDQPYQFDFYDGGGLEVTFLGMAEADQEGNVNVSKFGSTLAGCGGFIDISQNAKKVVFCSTFTSGGLKVDFSSGRVNILQEGKYKKFISKVEQITFSGSYAKKMNQEVLFVTERAVFRLLPEGLTLTEVAPGIDPKTHILPYMDFEPRIAKDLKVMDPRIFRDEPMGIREEILAKAKRQSQAMYGN
ncbi:MAG: acyl CoA:acetate/3-ketoacid CoA transferase [Clostridia bacterium]|nr:acyl CoA:acetate/3-ketoacid CoA transferase [Clostridia bacterium]